MVEMLEALVCFLAISIVVVAAVTVFGLVLNWLIGR